MSKRRRSRWRVGIAIVAVLMLSGCGSNGGDNMNGLPGSEGSAPLDQRESLNDYAARVLPALDDFQRALSAAGAGELQLAVDSGTPRFTVRPCGDDSWIIFGDVARGAEVPVETLIELGNERFIPLGLSEAQVDSGAEGRVSLSWHDAVNGGFVSVTHLEGSHTGMSSRSGCRPAVDPEALGAQLAEKYPVETGFIRYEDAPTKSN